jgi:hypothetical protein
VFLGLKKGIDNKSIDDLFYRIRILELGENPSSAKDAAADNGGVPYATAEELEQMTDTERFEAWFAWRVKEILPYYKAEVMRLHNISDEEYDRRTLEGDMSIYLPPNSKFEPIWYDERVVHCLGLNYQELQDKFKSGELKHLVAAGPNNAETGDWCDEDNRVF